MGPCHSREVRSPSESEDYNIKIAVLGPADSGKSTFFKQVMRIFETSDGSFDDSFKKSWICKVHGNIISFMQILLASSHCGTFESPDAIQAIRSLTEDDDVNLDNLPIFMAAWSDAGVQAAFQKRDLFRFSRELLYFMRDLERIASPHYVPTNADIIRCRDFRAEGVIDQRMYLPQFGGHMRLIDLVGPNLGKRKKWLPCFTAVDSIVFVVSLADYDMQSKEAPGENYMVEALRYFDEVCEYTLSERLCSINVLFNKRDIFAEKIATIPLSVCPVFATHAITDYEQALETIMAAFEERNLRFTSRQVYVHATCATDFHGFEFLFGSIWDRVLRTVLERDGSMNALI